MPWPMAEGVAFEFAVHFVERVAMLDGFANVVVTVGTAGVASRSR